MSIQHTPAPARSDLRPVGDPTGAPPYRLQGTVLTVGSLAWATTIAVFGLDDVSATARVLGGVGAGLFQLGLLSLLSVLHATRALGTGRLAQAVVRVESVLVALALASTLADTLGVSDVDALGWALLDACWPLSMLGMAALGVRVAVAGRWHGLTRWWPLVAESWAPVVIPAVALLGRTSGSWVAAGHLCAGYAVLGLLVARKRG